MCSFSWESPLWNNPSKMAPERLFLYKYQLKINHRAAHQNPHPGTRVTVCQCQPTKKKNIFPSCFRLEKTSTKALREHKLLPAFLFHLSSYSPAHPVVDMNDPRVHTGQRGKANLPSPYPTSPGWLQAPPSSTAAFAIRRQMRKEHTPPLLPLALANWAEWKAPGLL